MREDPKKAESLVMQRAGHENGSQRLKELAVETSEQQWEEDDQGSLWVSAPRGREGGEPPAKALKKMTRDRVGVFIHMASPFRGVSPLRADTKLYSSVAPQTQRHFSCKISKQFLFGVRVLLF